MPRTKKLKLCTQAEKYKSELFNHVDLLIEKELWDQALSDLHYLLRNAPSLRLKIYSKIASIHFHQKEYLESLNFLYKILPSVDVNINELAIKIHLLLKDKYHATSLLAFSPLKQRDKEKLFVKFFGSDPRIVGRNNYSQEISIRCPKCGTFLFYYLKEFFCPGCQKRVLF